ncbi:Nif3-like dinuclear metal center hexameric protein [Haloferax sp. MBLA0076]|uniref:Nif3-like dinuclear metal center hexameric protein n=1 Tax=Haloferax litoreum TaxID=2666140 RepID=A0A6A8GFF1_9EURY|nr:MULTISPECIES: Nif3-like dinuclear metal center hexameric protein [Haloferax]KAB1193375.1 Nif3-like dinuclear metal center hexameric protein [Haloferax sp. CBA1148]MRX21883.1 Nif3-like dinuclear metal center hexameric protein [Haloferax litoreum]
MDLSTVVARFDETLATGEFADVDASANGLQVGPDEMSVETVAFAVDAAEATIEAAVEAGADLLVTHHGLVWGGLDRVTGRDFSRIEPLIREDVALYVSHLPLDGHQELGNAAGLADHLGLVDRDPFGSLGPVHIGQAGSFESPKTTDEVRDALDELDGNEETQVFDFGPDEISDVAIVTGSGVDWLDEAIESGADALVTGEGKQKVYHEAREAGITVFLAGHYATETFGVRSLAERARKMGLEAVYISHPTGL